MPKFCCIYKITSPSGKIYIGKTSDFGKRVSVYKYMRCESQKHLHRSLLKYGFESHKIEILHALPHDVGNSVLSAYEVLYISQYKACGYTLLNCTDGGEGLRGYKHSEGTKLKISEWSKKPRVRKCGYRLSEETKKKMTISRTGKKPGQETRLKMSISQQLRRERNISKETTYNG